MTEIPASLVKELRDQSGAGMMDCKRALVETGGDLDAAQKLLREKGMAQAAKRAGRETTEGIVLARIDGDRGTIVAVGCETEPVSKNDEFRAFADQVLAAVESGGPDAVAGLEDERVALAAKLGENIAVVGATRFEAGAGEVLGAYVHTPANKVGVLVRARGRDDAMRELTMHLSFAAPRFLTRDEFPEAEVAAERAIYEKLPEVEGKPEQVRPKIIEGMLAKRLFAQAPGGGALVDQPWSREPSKTTGNALAEAGLEVIEFVRYSLLPAG
jgi:elongation factor Ts